MIKEFTMRCNEDQFQLVLPALDQYGIDYSEVQLDNDKCFVMFRPSANAIKSISSAEAIEILKKDNLFDRFHFNTFIGRISGLDWLEQKKQTMAEIFAAKPAEITPEDLLNDVRKELDTLTSVFNGDGITFYSGVDPAIEGDDATVQFIRKELDNHTPKPYPIDLPKTFEGVFEYSEQTFERSDESEFHISFFPKKESPISSGINISAGNAALAYMEFKKTHPEIEPFCIHDKSQL